MPSFLNLNGHSSDLGFSLSSTLSLVAAVNRFGSSSDIYLPKVLGGLVTSERRQVLWWSGTSEFGSHLGGGFAEIFCMTTTDIFMRSQIWEAAEWRTRADRSYEKCWFVYATQESKISNSAYKSATYNGCGTMIFPSMIRRQEPLLYLGFSANAGYDRGKGSAITLEFESYQCRNKNRSSPTVLQPRSRLFEASGVLMYLWSLCNVHEVADLSLPWFQESILKRMQVCW